MNTTLTSAQLSTLNSFLRGEISAVETYSEAIQQSNGEDDDLLAENRNCHGRRVKLLRETIAEAGGEPAASSGTWGNFTSLMEKGAALISKHMIFAVLEEGEDRGLKMYRNYDEDDDSVAQLILAHLLPAQIATHDRMRRLKTSAAPAR